MVGSFLVLKFLPSPNFDNVDFISFASLPVFIRFKLPVYFIMVPATDLIANLLQITHRVIIYSNFHQISQKDD